MNLFHIPEEVSELNISTDMTRDILPMSPSEDTGPGSHCHVCHVSLRDL